MEVDSSRKHSRIHRFLRDTE